MCARAVADCVEMEHVLRSAFDELAVQGAEPQLASYAAALRKEWFLTAGDLRAAISDDNVWSVIALPLRLKMQLKKILMACSREEVRKKGDVQQQHRQTGLESSIDCNATLPPTSLEGVLEATSTVGGGEEEEEEEEEEEKGEAEEAEGRGRDGGGAGGAEETSDAHMWERGYCERTGYPYFYHVITGESYWDSDDTAPHPDFVGNTTELAHKASTVPLAYANAEEDLSAQVAPSCSTECADDSEFARMLQAQFDREAMGIHAHSNSGGTNSGGDTVQVASESTALATPNSHHPAFDLATAPAAAIISAPTPPLREGALARALDRGIHHATFLDSIDTNSGAGRAETLHKSPYREEKADFSNYTNQVEENQMEEIINGTNEHATQPPTSMSPSAPALPTGNSRIPDSDLLGSPIRSLQRTNSPWLSVDTNIRSSSITRNGSDKTLITARMPDDILPTTNINDTTRRPATEADLFGELRGTPHVDGRHSAKPGSTIRDEPSGRNGPDTISVQAYRIVEATANVPELSNQPHKPSSTEPDALHTVPASAPEEATPIGFMSGMLWKKSRKHALIGSKWQKRWFELRHDALVYFQDVTSASPKNSSPRRAKASKFKLSSGMAVKLWWPDDSLWVNARVLQCKGRNSFDVIILKDKVSSIIGISNKWVKDVPRKRIRMMVPNNIEPGKATNESGNYAPRASDACNPGENSDPLASVPRYLGMIDTAASKTSNAQHLEARFLAGDDRNFPPQSFTLSELHNPSQQGPSQQGLQEETQRLEPVGHAGSGSPTQAKTLRGKGSLLKRIPLLNITALLRDPSSARKEGGFAIALSSGRVLELRASSSKVAEQWIRQLDALILSLSVQNGAVPLAPLENGAQGSSPGHSAGKQGALGQGSEESDMAFAVKLQEQFDREARRVASEPSERNVLTPPKTDSSLLRRLAKGGATPPSLVQGTATK